MALKEAIKEQLYIKAISKEIPFFPKLQQNTILTDSQSAMELAKNPGHHHRTKHIDIQYHFVREKVQNNECQLRYIPTKDQLADYLTKAMPNPKWKTFILGIGLYLGQKRKN